MEEVIKILTDTINNSDHSEKKSKDIELLLKAKAIEILKPQAESGIGFAMEAIAKIASSNINKEISISDAIDNLAKTIAMIKENQGK